MVRASEGASIGVREISIHGGGAGLKVRAIASLLSCVTGQRTSEEMCLVCDEYPVSEWVSQ